MSKAQQTESSKKHVKENSNSSSSYLSIVIQTTSKPFPVGNVAKPTNLKSALLMVNNALSATNLIILLRCVETSISSTKPTTTYNEKGYVVDEYAVNSDSESTLSLDPIQIDGLAVFYSVYFQW